MIGKYQGTLIGHSTYDKDGKTTHVYEVFCGGKKDKDSGLYTTECSIVRIRDEHELPNMAANMQVEFYGETKQGKNGQYMVYSDISAVGA